MSVFKHILVPFDKSDNAFNALKKALEFAREDGEISIDVVFSTVLPESQLRAGLTSFSGNGESSFPDINGIIEASNAAMEQEHSDTLELISDCIAGLEDQVTLTIVPGSSPVDDIVDFASEHECDVIIMGSRGLGAIRGMLGSVSTGVLRHAQMPVLVVK